MGKSRSYRPRKRKFHGNQNTCTETASCKEEIMTASSLKLQRLNQHMNTMTSQEDNFWQMSSRVGSLKEVNSSRTQNTLGCPK
ncbi:hypothetical protein TNIN_168371 [Trichonephila inaurata madagascariensis]|uniref:Uncharacterized protein n=1 Tax=Trichonephila inaurata madagascariensis TaxID=2747483 RepID=A0A8X6Y0A7_9ARAC|nr:hypothetical protein TNIN_168371 [Trichonephila inaurata madagascariensis]